MPDVRKKEFRPTKLTIFADIPCAPPMAKWQTRVVSVKEFDDHRREELILTAEGLPPLPVYLLLPRGKQKTGKRPAILALHGHGAHGHHPIAGRDDLPGVGNAIKNNNYDYGRQLVRQGYVVAAPCLTPFGDRLERRRRASRTRVPTHSFACNSWARC